MLAAQHHERLDGSGYPRGLSGERSRRRRPDPGGGRHLPVEGGAAPAPPGAARREEVADYLRGEVRAGRLDGAAVDAVLRAAGHRVRRRREWPAGLTAREVEVLRLVARGLSYQQIAEQLVISRKTASNHVERIYTKIGVTNRAMASLFAVRHGLLLADDSEPDERLTARRWGCAPHDLTRRHDHTVDA